MNWTAVDATYDKYCLRKNENSVRFPCALKNGGRKLNMTASGLSIEKFDRLRKMAIVIALENGGGKWNGKGITPSDWKVLTAEKMTVAVVVASENGAENWTGWAWHLLLNWKVWQSREWQMLSQMTHLHHSPSAFMDEPISTMKSRAENWDQRRLKINNLSTCYNW